MELRSARLGWGDWLLGAGSLLLLIDLFGVTWFQYRPQFHSTAAMLGQRVSANGWQSFEALGPLALVVCVAGLAVCALTATRRSPALPVVLTTLLTPVSLALVVLSVVDVLLDPPSVHLAQAGGANVIERCPGAYAGIVLSIVVFVAVFSALRREGVAPGDAPRAIETLDVGERSASGQP